jgi:hypothetical protein
MQALLRKIGKWTPFVISFVILVKIITAHWSFSVLRVLKPSQPFTQAFAGAV